MTADDLHHDLEGVLRFLRQEHPETPNPPHETKHLSDTAGNEGGLPLDSHQALAATHLHGPMRVMAPAGSGKTRTLVSRITFLLNQGVPAESILALAFNRKAQQEMNERLNALGYEVQVRTFHAFGYEIVRRAYGWEYHENSHGCLLELLRDAVTRHVNAPDFRPKTFDPILTALRQATMELVPLETLHVQINGEPLPFAPVFKDFLAAQLQQKFLNFDGMIYHALRALLDEHALRSELQNRFEYLLVDEFQDLNRAQLLLTQIMALPQNNLFVVGDDDQMIYGWRGADVRLILDFPEIYPNAKTIVLATNYRSTKKIIHHSRMLIEHNPERVEKDIQPRPGAERGTLDILLAPGIRAQAKAALDWIETQKSTHRLEWHDFAILYRANSYVFPLLPLLEQRGIPFVQAREDRDEEDDPPETQAGALNLMTIHKSKGKEFPWVVYFNLSRSGSGEVETSVPEERRVAYVAATRAQQGLLITADEGHYSQFLVEWALNREFDNYALPYLERQENIVHKKCDKIKRELTKAQAQQENYLSPSHFSFWPFKRPGLQENLIHKINTLNQLLTETEDRLELFRTEIRFRSILNVKTKYTGRD